MPERTSYDVVIVGGGHNGLVAAAYLARAGRTVLLLERLDHTGGAAVSARAFTGIDARLSRYSYLVSLLPPKIVRDLGLRFAVRKRTVSSYTPTVRAGRPTGLLVGAGADRTRASFGQLTGSAREYAAWEDFYGTTRRLAERVFPTLTEPLPTRAALRARVDDDATWHALFERPLGETIEAAFHDDLVRGVVLTDGLIGTFTTAHDPTLRQNRCFLYHVIGGGTGDWDVPLGGMGALTDALADAARRAGAELVTGCPVTALATDGRTAEVTTEGHGTVAARHVLVNAAPRELARLLGDPAPPPAEGAQLKVNMLLTRLPRLRDPHTDPREAFSGTFHVAEGYAQLETAHREAAAGRLPSAPPSEIYCHSLTDPSILGADLVRRGYHTLTLFGLHAPARLFATDTAEAPAARDRLLAATLAQLDAHLAEPLADCLAEDADGRPCVEARSPLDLDRELGLPGGNIFHRELAFPHAEDTADLATAAARWGVATDHANVLLCGAGALRGGGVSGIPGHNAAMAVLEEG
ncbi:phytoene desaturase family protein [Streptomyces noursei]|uniref:phytoene desaturase family protein n=1 Tax=Streptomyces noursei TaxID=1971 RepID=UPI00045F0F8A|nr:NAD(P)/FAD-dependent oxidoreductase [Streptomyces noursei]AIA02249.1 oxidoreductase [Streptomyces noursei]